MTLTPTKQSDASLRELGDAIAACDLPRRQYQVFSALTDEPQTPEAIAERLGINTTSPRETASRYCLKLLDRGLAERAGLPMHPRWKRAAKAHDILIRRYPT